MKKPLRFLSLFIDNETETGSSLTLCDTIYFLFMGQAKTLLRSNSNGSGTNTLWQVTRRFKTYVSIVYR